MKVAVVYPIELGDTGHVGGGERYALELARALARRVEARLVTFGARRESQAEAGLRVETFPRWWRIRGRLNNPANPAFISALRDVDVVHCIGWHVIPSDIAILFARSTGKRVFVTDVGGGADVSLARFLPIGGLVHRFLFLSDYARSLFPRFSERSAVIYGGADDERFRPGGPRERKVVYVGRIIPVKGIEYAIEAVPPDVPLTVVGRPYDPAYFDALRQRAAGRDVRFVTDADDDRVAAELRSARVAVFPSVRSSSFAISGSPPETLALVLLEAMASGTPVVCTDVGPQPELVDDGRTGFVVPPNDTDALRERIALLLNDADLGRRMGERGRAVVRERFTWPATADRCLHWYGHGEPGRIATI